MAVKVATTRKVEVLTVDVEALKHPGDDPKVVSLREQAERLSAEVDQLQQQQVVMRPAIAAAQAELARAVGSGDAAARRTALDSIDDATGIDSRLAARVPVLSRAAITAEGELGEAMTAAAKQCGLEWDEARGRLGANLEELHDAERTCRLAIGRLEEARLAAFSFARAQRGTIAVRFLRRHGSYNVGEIASFAAKEAERLFADGTVVYANEARAKAALALAGLA